MARLMEFLRCFALRRGEMKARSKLFSDLLSYIVCEYVSISRGDVDKAK